MKRNSKALCLLLAGTMVAGNCPVATVAAEPENGAEQLLSGETLENKTTEAKAAEEVAETVDAAETTVEETEIINEGDTTGEMEAVTDVQEEAVNADTLTKGDFNYTQAEDGSITITSYAGAGGTADIAGTFAGENVVAIGNYAFSPYNSGHTNQTGKRAISRVILPITLKSIGEYAFYYCEGLSTVTFAEGTPQLETIGKNAFCNCTALASITMPDTLLAIGEQAFSNCTALGSITIPSQVPGIPASVFSYCDGLKKVEINSNDIAINDNAFWACKSALTFYGDEGSTAKAFAAEKGFRFQRYSDSISVKTLPTKTSYYYGESLNTTGLTIEVDFTSDTEPAIAEIADSECNFSGYNKNKVGAQTITVSYADKTATFPVTVYYNLANATVATIKNQTYTGSAVTPEVTVTGKETGVALEKDKDYTLEYENNTEVGTATVKIIGKGDYMGTLEKTFTITQRSLKTAEISASVPTVTYDGTAQKPVPVIQDGEKLLTAEDYEIDSYSSNTNAGTGQVCIVGKGNYSGTIYVPFTIEPKDISVYKVKDIPDQLYSQYPLKPQVVVQVDEYTNLQEGTDYTVRYKDNTEIGTATVSVEGKGNYKGTIEKTFTIKAKSLENVTVGSVDDYTFTGKSIEPEVSVYDESYDATLVKGKDYTVSYKNNVNAGTATIVIQGMGSYEGTIEKTFDIKPRKLYRGNITVSNVDTCTYTGEACTPSFKLSYDDGDVVLTEGVDYTVSYKDNVNAGNGTIVIEGKGNYSGGSEEGFTILPKSLVGITVNDLPGYTYTGEAIKPAIAVKLDGITLKEDVDYKVSYSDNVDVGEATVWITGMGNYQGMVDKSFDIKKKSIADIGIRNIANHIYTGAAIEPVVSLELDVNTTLTKGVDYQIQYVNNVNVGTATVQVQGTGNYTGVIEKTFKITPKSLNGSSIVVAEPVSAYTGSAKTPGVSVVSGSKTLSLGREYTVSYRNNKNIGTATVVVTGIGNYTGSISKNFTIQAKKGSTITVGAYKYKVSSSTEVSFAGLKSSKTTKVSIPSTVKIGGKSFKVTSVANKALKGKTVTSVTIGKNVKTIGTSAFEKCSKLKNVTVKSTVLKKVGKSAFKGINAKAKIKVPKKNLTSYKKLMKGKGQSSTVKITK